MRSMHRFFRFTTIHLTETSSLVHNLEPTATVIRNNYRSTVTPSPWVAVYEIMIVFDGQSAYNTSIKINLFQWAFGSRLVLSHSWRSLPTIVEAATRHVSKQAILFGPAAYSLCHSTSRLEGFSLLGVSSLRFVRQALMPMAKVELWKGLQRTC